MHPRIPGQRELSPRQAREGMAVPAGTPDQAAFPAGLLPASEPDRATMGSDAQEHHAQQMLPDPRRIRRSDPGFPARRGPQEVGRTLRFGHRQLSYNFTQGFSPPGVNWETKVCHDHFSLSERWRMTDSLASHEALRPFAGGAL